MISIKDGIILSNHHFIAYNKPGGIAVQSVQNKEDSLEVKLQQYCKVPLHLIHRNLVPEWSYLPRKNRWLLI